MKDERPVKLSKFEVIFLTAVGVFGILLPAYALVSEAITTTKSYILTLNIPSPIASTFSSEELTIPTNRTQVEKFIAGQKTKILTPDNTPMPISSTANWNPKNLDNEISCLAQNMYHEARGQGVKGLVAVGLVTINRVVSKKYPNTICGVVWEKRLSPKYKKMVPQFSWTLDGNSDVPTNIKVWKDIYSLASGMLSGKSLTNFYDFTDGSTHYHADYVDPWWNKTLDHKITIGSHIFYRDYRALPVDMTNGTVI